MEGYSVDFYFKGGNWYGLPSVDKRKRLSVKVWRHRKIEGVHPFRKLKLCMRGFTTDSGYDIVFVMEGGILAGSGAVLK